jgi:quercetin dioxygenase-like cupin family protein
VTTPVAATLPSKGPRPGVNWVGATFQKRKKENSMLKRTLAFAAIIAFFAVGALHAQQAAAPAAPTIKRTPLQKFDVPNSGSETVMGIAEIVPNANIGRHTHPGPESGYLLEGEMVLMIDGQPDKPLKAGESYLVPSGAVHDAKAGPKGVKVIATYVVEKGKPLASPAK